MTPTEVGAVYLHAPFCTRRCFYCDFAVSVEKNPDPGPWVHALGRELESLLHSGEVVLESSLQTLYVGGGTPSLLGPQAMEPLRSLFPPGALDGPELEWTCEANPESVTPVLISAWCASGVNRLSLGVQSFDESVLRWMGRLHGAEGALRAVQTVVSHGIENYSIDLMFGLPEGVPRSWQEELGRAIDLGAPHLSLYGLTAEERTPLGKAVGEGRVMMPEQERYREEYLAAAEALTAAGYVHYEVSNFCLPGRESRHNSVYWSGDAYLGLGNGAHSYLPPLRRWNLRNWEEYQGAVQGGRSPVEGDESLSPEAIRLERIWLALRTRAGFPLEEGSQLSVDLAERWAARGLATVQAGVIRLNAEGWLVMDELTVDLESTMAVEGQRG